MQQHQNIDELVSILQDFPTEQYNRITLPEFLSFIELYNLKATAGGNSVVDDAYEDSPVKEQKKMRESFASDDVIITRGWQRDGRGEKSVLNLSLDSNTGSDVGNDVNALPNTNVWQQSNSVAVKKSTALSTVIVKDRTFEPDISNNKVIKSIAVESRQSNDRSPALVPSRTSKSPVNFRPTSSPTTAVDVFDMKPSNSPSVFASAGAGGKSEDTVQRNVLSMNDDKRLVDVNTSGTLQPPRVTTSINASLVLNSVRASMKLKSARPPLSQSSTSATAAVAPPFNPVNVNDSISNKLVAISCDRSEYVNPPLPSEFGQSMNVLIEGYLEKKGTLTGFYQKV